MRPVRAIFLDDGGVLSDNTIRAAEWERLIAEYLSPRLGGEPSRWEDANRVVFEAQLRRWETWMAEQPLPSFSEFFTSREENVRWLSGMCERVGIAIPTDDECHALAVETKNYVMPRVRCAFDGAAETVETLAASGYRLFTASSGTHRELDAYLTGMGVRERFGERLYGPDIVQRHKHSVDYYRKVFEDSGIDPAEALVVDDSAGQVELARAAGARAVLVSQDARAVDSIAALRELPQLLDAMR
ncbi:MAG: HAD-IA family hydrolase [Dehalococcoidia bacterium]